MRRVSSKPAVVRLELLDLRVRDAGDRERRRAALDDPAGLEQVEHGERVEREREVQGLHEQRRPQVGDERPLAVPGLEDVQVHQDVDRLAQRRARDPELRGELALGRQAAARRQHAAQDRLLDAGDGLRRHAGALDRPQVGRRERMVRWSGHALVR